MQSCVSNNARNVILHVMRCVSRRCPWWLYICNQLGFIRGFLPSIPSQRVEPCGLHASFEWASSWAETRYAKIGDPMGRVLVNACTQSIFLNTC
jgi:hypothetical protein